MPRIPLASAAPRAPYRTARWLVLLLCVATLGPLPAGADPLKRKASVRGSFALSPELRAWAQQRRWSKPGHTARLQLKGALTPLPQFEPGTLTPAKHPDPVKAAASIDWASVRRFERRVQRVEGRGVTSTRMKAFERLVKKQAPAQPLRRLYVVSELHLLETMKDLFEGMVDAGALESRLVLQGVRHSQQPGVIREMQRWGIGTRAARVDQQKQQFRRLALNIVQKARQEPDAKFLVVGHGGRLHALLSQLVDRPGVPRDLTQRVGIVETTRKGQLRMEGLWRRLGRKGASKEARRYRFPVVDIGEHWAKVHFESPTIGRGIVNAMGQHLADLGARGAGGLDLRRGRVPVLIVGYGAVGRATARLLRRQGYEVHVHDLKFDRRKSKLLKRARRDGMQVHSSLASALAAGPRVIGSATGGKPWTAATVGRIPQGTVVFNLASPGEMDGLLEATSGRAATGRPGGGGQVRFCGRALALQQVSPDHRDSVRTVGGKELLLARGGQVINLALGGNEPPEYIQVTRGLVWLATLKGASVIGQRPGRYRLEDRAVKGFVNDVQRDLKAAGLGALQDPTF